MVLFSLLKLLWTETGRSRGLVEMPSNDEANTAIESLKRSFVSR